MEDEWSIAVEGAQIAAMPEKDRWAIIREPAPEYLKDEGATNPEKNRIKLIAHVELADGRKADYYMNRTSARAIAGILKTDLSAEGMKSWVSYKIFWGNISDQNVGGNMKKVLYVTDVKPTEDAVKTEKVK